MMRSRCDYFDTVMYLPPRSARYSRTSAFCGVGLYFPSTTASRSPFDRELRQCVIIILLLFCSVASKVFYRLMSNEHTSPELALRKVHDRHLPSTFVVPSQHRPSAHAVHLDRYRRWTYIQGIEESGLGTDSGRTTL